MDDSKKRKSYSYLSLNSNSGKTSTSLSLSQSFVGNNPTGGKVYTGPVPKKQNNIKI